MARLVVGTAEGVTAAQMRELGFDMERPIDMWQIAIGDTDHIAYSQDEPNIPATWKRLGRQQICVLPRRDES